MCVATYLKFGVPSASSGTPSPSSTILRYDWPRERPRMMVICLGVGVDAILDEFGNGLQRVRLGKRDDVDRIPVVADAKLAGLLREGFRLEEEWTWVAIAANPTMGTANSSSEIEYTWRGCSTVA